MDKINVYKVYNLQFFNGRRASCLWFMKHYQTKEKLKNLQYLPIKSPFFIWQWYFPKKGYYYAFIVQKCKKPHFLNKISSKFFNFLHGPRID